MAKKRVNKNKESSCDSKVKRGCGCGGCTYFLGFIGSCVYYISAANGFWAGVLGVLKSIVWPAFLVHGLFKFLGI